MAQQVHQVENEETGQTEYHLEISDRDLAIFFRAFAQPPEEAMRLAEKFEEDPIVFSAMCQKNREEILSQLEEQGEVDNLYKLMREIEEEVGAKFHGS